MNPPDPFLALRIAHARACAEAARQWAAEVIDGPIDRVQSLLASAREWTLRARSLERGGGA